jgi:hypothetical protein
MKTRWLWVLSFAFALPLFAQEKAPAPTQVEQGKAAGVELGTAEAGAIKKGGGTRCTLTLSPNHAPNGGTFSFSVAYTPCLSLVQTETFTFKWASTLPNFTEVTVRQKIFKKSIGCVGSSFDQTIVPAATGISGPFTATVAVKKTVGGAPICTASAAMTVP